MADLNCRCEVAAEVLCGVGVNAHIERVDGQVRLVVADPQGTEVFIIGPDEEISRRLISHLSRKHGVPQHVFFHADRKTKN